MWRPEALADPLCKNSRGGYTLIEMLIASVLVAALMSVVWGMMSMYNSYLTAGQSQAVEQQLIRSIFQLLDEDLQDVALPDSNPKITPAIEVNGEFPSTSADIAGPVTDPLGMSTPEPMDEPSIFAGPGSAGNIEAPGQVSLSGNSSSVRLSIERLPLEGAPPASHSNSLPGQLPDAPTADSLPQPVNISETRSVPETTAMEGMAPDVQEFQTIIWQFQAPGAAASGSQSLRFGLYRIQTDSLALQTAMSQQESLPENGVPDGAAAVDRMTMESLLFPSVDRRNETPIAEVGGSENAAAIPQFDVIPEVVGCRFEYFSGSAWTSSWNSDQQNGLPVAVRVRLRLVTPGNLEKLSQFFGTTSSQVSPLDDALDDAAGATSSPVPSTPLSPEDVGADPLRTIPTRQIERIIQLQPITGPMPQPGVMEQSDALPEDSAGRNEQAGGVSISRQQGHRGSRRWSGPYPCMSFAATQHGTQQGTQHVQSGVASRC